MEKMNGLIASFDPNTGRGALITDNGEQIRFDIGQIKVDIKIAAGMKVSYILSPDKTSLAGLSTFEE